MTLMLANQEPAMPTERRWFRLPRLVRILLLLPVVLGIEVALILLLYPQIKLPEATFHDLLLSALLLMVSVGSADLPNWAHLNAAPTPATLLGPLLEAFAWLALITFFTWDVAWLYTYWPTPRVTSPYGWNRATYILVATAFGMAIGACEAWLHLGAPPGTVPAPTSAFSGASDAVSPRFEAWQLEERARSQIYGLRRTTVFGRFAFSLIWPVLLLITLLSTIALVLLLLPIDPAQTVLAAGLCSASFVGGLVVFLGLSRFTRAKPADSETDEANADVGSDGLN